MGKTKTTINLEYATYNQADKVRKMLGIDNFSNFAEYILNKFCNNPTEVIKDKMKHHQQKLMYYSQVLEAIEEVEEQRKIEVSYK